MRSFILASAIAGLAAAAPAPAPQNIDFDLADSVPNPKYTMVPGLTAQVVSYNPTTVYSAALSQITSTDDDDYEDFQTDAPEKRAATYCSPQPTGRGPVPNPDTPAAFTALPDFAASASAAATPSGYSANFINQQSSNNAYGYLGYSLLTKYDSTKCAAKCNAVNGCIAFNIYFERDPLQDPGYGDSGCPNPPSTTTIKCVLWGGPVNVANAGNFGQLRNQFQILMAGSNGYTNNSIAVPSGYGTAVPYGNAAINAPFDKLGYNTFLGDALFVGAFSAQLCADACTQKSNYALAHPPTDGSPAATCQFFNTYILYINSTNNLQGQYCAMYSETWDASYATNVGQYRGNDHYMIEYSFGYSNTTNPGTPDANAAAHQASVDITYATLQTYCSTLLGYTTPAATATSTTTLTMAPAKRTVASTPDVLTKYPAAIVTSACGMVASPYTTTVVATVTPAPDNTW